MTKGAAVQAQEAAPAVREDRAVAQVAQVVQVAATAVLVAREEQAAVAAKGALAARVAMEAEAKEVAVPEPARPDQGVSSRDDTAPIRQYQDGTSLLWGIAPFFMFQAISV